MTTTAKHLAKTFAGLLAAATVAALAAPSGAFARGGSYTITGATPDQAAQVKAALDASAFDWGVIGRHVTIQVAPGIDSVAYRGVIQLDANLVDSGVFSWGVIQHEYAHQVDYYLLDSSIRTKLSAVLGGSAWGAGITYSPTVAHDDQTGERFANELTWSFWPSADNAIERTTDRFTAKAFRGYLGALLKPVTTAAARQAAPAAGATAAVTATTTATTVAATPVAGATQGRI